ncbi:MFS transporter, partial [Microbacterium schleiferi]|uniref:MFS transporter n=2 Tax=Microbacteriaceae TaxID=85023 RepID=UPI0035C7FB1D
VGLSPVQAGFALVPSLASVIVSGLLVVPIASRIPPRIVVPAALMFSMSGYLLVAATAGSGDLGWLLLASVLLGIGIGAAETVSNELVMASAPPSKAGAAGAVSETAYELGAVLGTAVLGSILTASYRSGIAIPAGVPTDLAAQARETLAGAYVTAGELAAPIADALRAAAAAAFDSGVAVTAAVGAGLVVLAAVIAATTLGSAPSSVNQAARSENEESNVARGEASRHPR